MRYKVLVITQDEFSLGFKVAGIKTHSVKNSQQAKMRLIQEMNLKEYGIILLDETLVEDFETKLKEKIFNSELPLIFTTPLKKDFKEKVKDAEFLEFIKNAIGYQIRLK